MATEEDKKFYKEHRHEPYQQLERAMKSRDLRKIRYLIRTGKVDPNVRLCSFMSRKSLLHIFISDFNEFSLSQRKELIRLMVARGADIHVKNDDGNSILSDVADSMPLLKFFLTEFKFSDEEMQEAVSLKTLKLLIQNGLQISPDVVKNLFLSAYDVKAIKFLMEEYHVSANCVDKDGLTPIHHAVQSSLEMVKFLLAHGADVNSRGRSGITPLMLTTSLEIFNFLIEHGADVYAVDQQQRNVLLWQIENSGSLAIIKALAEQYHFDVNQPDEVGTSPLMLTARHNNLDMAKYLVDNGANVNAVDNEGHNALFYLCKRYAPDKQLLFQYLITRRVDVKHLDKCGKNVLFYATKHIELLLKAGADATVVADDGTTVLMNHLCLSFSDFKLLIRHGADPGKYAEKLLRWRLADTHYRYREDEEEEIMLYLIKKYSLDPNTRNEAGRTPLFYSLITWRKLIELGASYEITDKDGNTPLIYWVAKRGIFPHDELPAQHYQKQNNEGKTALHYAVRNISFYDFKILLDYGADWRIKDNSGRTALDYARELKRFDICELMENYNHSI